MKKLYVVLIISALCFSVKSQVITRTVDEQFIENRTAFREVPDMEVVTMPPVDVNALLAEDKEEETLGLPFRFGAIIDVNLNLNNSGSWTESSEGSRVWRINIVCKGAYSINLSYKKFELPEGSELYIYNSEKTVLQGPLNSTHNLDGGSFATDLIPGESVVLEYYEPLDAKNKGKINIGKVIHGYKDIFNIKSSKGFGDSGDCNIDVNCPEGDGWQSEANAVALVIGVNKMGTGALINNTCQDFIPYFLTANHLIEGEDVSNWSFIFQYMSPFCNGGDDFRYISYNGATLRTNNTITDFALLELNQRPDGRTGITYAGWSRNNNAPNSAVGIHHPSGDVMKISFEEDVLTTNLIIEEIGDMVFAPNMLWEVIWNDGTTENGSSGSPLFDPNHRIIGQLAGGGASCTNQNGTDSYGRFDVSWTGGGTNATRLSNWLDPNNIGTITTNTISIPYVTGPSTVCTSNTMFTIVNRPPGSTITWTRSNNIIYVSGQGTNNYIVRTNDNGPGGTAWVQANITTGNCEAAPFRKTIGIGRPVSPNRMTGPTQLTPGLGAVYSVSGVQGVVDRYKWTIPSGCYYNYCWKIKSGQGTRSISVQAGKVGSGTIYFVARNSCGTASEYKFVNVQNPSGGGGGGSDPCDDNSDVLPMKLSPNPNNGHSVVLRIDEPVPCDDDDMYRNSTANVSIMNSFGTIVYSGQHHGNHINITGLNLITGIYYVRYAKNNIVLEKTMIVEQ